MLEGWTNLEEKKKSMNNFITFLSTDGDRLQSGLSCTENLSLLFFCKVKHKVMSSDTSFSMVDVTLLGNTLIEFRSGQIFTFLPTLATT